MKYQDWTHYVATLLDTPPDYALITLQSCYPTSWLKYAHKDLTYSSTTFAQ